MNETNNAAEEDVDVPEEDEVENDDQNEDENDDARSVSSDGSEGSIFLGSLGIYAPEGTWESDLRVNLDLQLGRDEWMTSFSSIEGGMFVICFSATFFIYLATLTTDLFFNFKKLSVQTTDIIFT